jgi:hypothetical protein
LDSIFEFAQSGLRTRKRIKPHSSHHCTFNLHAVGRQSIFFAERDGPLYHLQLSALEFAQRLVGFCQFFEGRGVKGEPMRSCSVFISTSWCRKVWGKQEWQRHESWGSDSGSCCVTRLITKSSAVVDSCERSTVVPMRECLLENMILRSSDRIPE